MTVTGRSSARTSCHLPTPAVSRSAAVCRTAVPAGTVTLATESVPPSSMPTVRIAAASAFGLTMRRLLTWLTLLAGLKMGTR